MDGGGCIGGGGIAGDDRWDIRGEASGCCEEVEGGRSGGVGVASCSSTMFGLAFPVYCLGIAGVAASVSELGFRLCTLLLVGSRPSSVPERE
jgi:hypothetical protein